MALKKTKVVNPRTKSQKSPIIAFGERYWKILILGRPHTENSPIDDYHEKIILRVHLAVHFRIERMRRRQQRRRRRTEVLRLHGSGARRPV